MCSAMDLHSGSITAAVTWTSSATDIMSQDPFRKENPWVGRKKILLEKQWGEGNILYFCSMTQKYCTELRAINESLRHNSCCLKRGGWPAVSCGGLSNKFRVPDYDPMSVASRSWCLHQWAALCLVSCPHSPLTAFHHVSTSICQSILRFAHMVILIKIPNPQYQQTERSEDVTSGNPVRAQLPHKTP